MLGRSPKRQSQGWGIGVGEAHFFPLHSFYRGGGGLAVGPSRGSVEETPKSLLILVEFAFDLGIRKGFPLISPSVSTCLRYGGCHESLWSGSYILSYSADCGTKSDHGAIVGC